MNLIGKKLYFCVEKIKNTYQNISINIFLSVDQLSIMKIFKLLCDDIFYHVLKINTNRFYNVF